MRILEAVRIEAIEQPQAYDKDSGVDYENRNDIRVNGCIVRHDV
jgi:hypothetical protein